MRKCKVSMAGLMLCAAVAQAEVIYEEDFSSGYTKGGLIGQQGWSQQQGKRGPSVWEYAGDGWAVIGRAVSEDAWAWKTLELPELKPSDRLILEITIRRGVPGSKEGSALYVGFGAPDGKLPAGIGAANDGVTLRAGWAPTTPALRADGSRWGDRENAPPDYIEHREKLVLRSEWNLREGTGTLAVKNLTRGETDFTPLFFDAAQRQRTAPIGFTGNVSTWNRLLIRTGGKSAARVYSIKLMREAGQ